MVNLDEIYKELKRGVSEIIDEEKVKDLIKNYYEKGENFYVKIGMDPTAPDLHLGHSVTLQKMAFLQAHGAIIMFLIGDFTAQIGDPSGKSETRKKLSKDVVLENAKTYEKQVFKVLDKNKTKIMFNSDWLNKMNAADMIELASTYSVARMLERDDFEKRYKNQTPISISEFLYPLLQGHDSVVMKCDIEMGGTDQKFNLLMGRHLQRIYNTGKEQAVITMPLLVGLDGVNKMSKSLNNYIGVTDEPNQMYAKTLSISDELMWEWYKLLSTKSLKEIDELKKGVENGTIHPKEVKEALALEITARFHDENLAKKAKEEFDKIHTLNKLPSSMEEFEIKDEIWVVEAIVKCGLASSNSQARRHIKANAFSIDQKKIDDENLVLKKGKYVLQIGKKNFARLKVV
ncbi:tyrosine--tRNA ligase [Campylobacter ureolyticus]|uniref:Tyrosine--tRNA ligase n=1 Tax=Campylobacter ureolyticus TaxID=827 RepID=A0AAE7E9U2_9BACT|nr:tyrosine--tRNA ligase [Campylobacter ureolyticus]MCR8684211.1 tyrosine--tRNA ligase [Campylobacter ureolyticus]QKF84247.1 tyrosyl-tRNA synthetase [Campylobacter ureolyticus]QQY35599.1 tyrosine--tRNA ligase [Campylobacter ureolyticus]SUX23545.1 Tyrosyl-tRNA synthetase [Campylobacter ureolyticus]